MTQELNDERVLTTRQLMAKLHIGKDKAYALMRNKSFPSIKLGKTYIITQESLDSWLKLNAGREFHL